MVVTDQYMQKMEKELTEVRQRVVRIETAMQKFLSQSTDMAKNARMEKEKGKKDEKKVTESANSWEKRPIMPSRK